MSTVTIELPSQLYATLESLAEEEQVDLVEMLCRWAELTRQRRRWLHNWAKLDALVAEEGGLYVGATRDEVVAQLREQRGEIFEAEYAHLY